MTKPDIVTDIGVCRDCQWYYSEYRRDPPGFDYKDTYVDLIGIMTDTEKSDMRLCLDSSQGQKCRNKTSDHFGHVLAPNHPMCGKQGC